MHLLTYHVHGQPTALLQAVSKALPFRRKSAFLNTVFKQQTGNDLMSLTTTLATAVNALRRSSQQRGAIDRALGL